MPEKDLILLFPRSNVSIDAEYVRGHAASGATVVALVDPANALDRQKLLAYQFPEGVDLSDIEGFRLRDIVLVADSKEGPCHHLMLYVWNSDSSCYNIDAVRIPWDRIEGTKDPRNNPLGKNPTNYWDFARERASAFQKQVSLGCLPDQSDEPAAVSCGHGFCTDALERLIKAHTTIEGAIHAWLDDGQIEPVQNTVGAAGRTFRRIPEGVPDAIPVLKVEHQEFPVNTVSDDEITWEHAGCSARAEFTDCRAGLAKLDRGSVTHTVTSPPYNIGYTPFNVGKMTSRGQMVAPARKAYSDSLSDEAYNGLLASTFAEIDNAASPDRLDVFINVKNSYKDATCVPPFYMLELMPSRWKLVDLIIWRYDISFDPGRSKYKPLYEWIIRVGYGDIPQPDRTLKAWYLPIVKGNSMQRKGLKHPAMYPQQLVEKVLIESDARRPGSLVVDPFLGSGTTIAASMNHRVSSVGFELSTTFRNDVTQQMKAFEEPQIGDENENPKGPNITGTLLFDR